MYKFRKKGLSLVLAAGLILSSTCSFAAQSFSDMPPVGHWAREALELAAENGLVSGYNGNIMPYGTVSRAQMAAIMNKVYGAVEEASLAGFVDVDPKAWYYTEMAKAVQLEIFKGSGNKLNPLSNITREQVCVVLANAFNLTAEDTTSLNAFSDKNKINTWAVEGVAAMVSAGYMKGSAGMIKPLDNITRAELAALMNNMVQTYLNEAGIYEGTFEGNVMINAPGVSFKNAIIKGDLFIGEGISSDEITLDGLMVMGRIVIKGSAMITELELIEEEIALGTGNNPGNAGSGGSTPPPTNPTPPPTTPPTPPISNETTLKLTAVNEKMAARVMPKLTTEKQLAAATLIMNSISKYIADSSYDITSDINEAKVIGAQMSPEEYTYFKNTITGNIPISELVALNNYFKVIEY